MDIYLKDETIQRIKSQLANYLERFKPLFNVSNDNCENSMHHKDKIIPFQFPNSFQDEIFIPPVILNQIREFLSSLIFSGEFDCFQEIDSDGVITDIGQFHTEIVKLKLNFERHTSILNDENIIYSRIDLHSLQGYSIDYKSNEKLRGIHLCEDVLLLLNNKDHLALQYDINPCFNRGLNTSLQFGVELTIKVFQIRKMYIPFIRYVEE